MITEERTRKEVDGIQRLLAPAPGAKLLDLCCGHGRITIPLAQLGCHMTGQDLSEYFLERARRDAEAKGLSVRWVRGDMRRIPFEGEFDAVINVFSSFGYLEDESEDAGVLRQVHKALKPGGRFLSDEMNRDFFFANYHPSSITRRPSGVVSLEEHAIDLITSRDNLRLTLIDPDGSQRTHRYSLRLYTARERLRMLADCGLQVEAVYGSFDGIPLTLRAPRLIIVARKPL